MSRNARDNLTGSNVRKHDGTRSNRGAGADFNRPQNSRTCTDKNAALDSRNQQFPAASTDDNLRADIYIVTDNRSSMHYHTEALIGKCHPFSDLNRWWQGNREHNAIDNIHDARQDGDMQPK